MNTQNNKICQPEKYNDVENSKKPLNKKEIDELKVVLEIFCFGSSENVYSRKIYDLFINNKIFEPNTNNTDYVDDLCCLGVYCQYIVKDYNLMKKYYLQAIDKGYGMAMNKLGFYHQYTEINYDLAIKYYLQAIDKGNSNSMYNLGFYYEYVEQNYDLAKKYYLLAVDKGNYRSMHSLGVHYQYIEINYGLMKKYYLQAIDKENSGSMNNLGYYYQYVERNYDLAKKYYLMAICEGSEDSINNLEYCYIHNLPSDDDLQNYFCALIKMNNIINRSHIFNNDEYIKENRTIDLFCSNINNVNLKIENFKFCLFRIINYINSCKLYKICESCKLKKIKHFAGCINKLRYRNKNKPEYKKYANELFKNKTSQIFMEYLDLHYWEHLEKIFAPGGEGYIKTKNHFELLVKQQ